MVNEKKNVSGLVGSVKVTFLGANGQEFTLDNPLVSATFAKMKALRRGCFESQTP
jgi:hypothetical protein